MMAPECYRFGDVTLDVEERRLSRGRTALHLPPKAYDVLVALARRAGRLVTKQELLAEVWPDAFVEEASSRSTSRRFARRSAALVHLAVAPQWDELRSDPRFAARLIRMGLPAVPVAAAV